MRVVQLSSDHGPALRTFLAEFDDRLAKVRTGYDAFRWTADTGMQMIGPLQGPLFAKFATAVSTDGTIVAGTAGVNNNTYNEQYPFMLRTIRTIFLRLVEMRINLQRNSIYSKYRTYVHNITTQSNRIQSIR